MVLGTPCSLSSPLLDPEEDLLSFASEGSTFSNSSSSFNGDIGVVNYSGRLIGNVIERGLAKSKKLDKVLLKGGLLT